MNSNEQGKTGGLGVAVRGLSLALRFLVGAVIIGLGIGLFSFLVMTKAKPAQHAIEEKSLTVGVLEARRVMVERVWSGFGTVRSMSTADVASQVAGRVVERPESIEAGVPVDKGDLIVQIERSDYERAVEAAEQLVASTRAAIESLRVDQTSLNEQVELAEDEVEVLQREFDRAVQAREQGAGTESAVDLRRSALQRSRRELSAIRQRQLSISPEIARLEAQVANLQAQLATARENLARTTITSPITGFLQDVMVEEGELLAVGSPVTRVVDARTLEIPLRVPVSASRSVSLGDTVELSSDGASDNEWEGTVSRIAPEADPRTRTMTLFVTVEQDVTYAMDHHRPVDAQGNRLLLPGQFVVGDVRGAPGEAIVIPRHAVDKDRVMLVGAGTNGEARARSVPVVVSHYVDRTFGDLDGGVGTQWAVIESGIEPGERVIVTNLDELEHNMSVRIASEQVAAAPKGGDGAQ